MVQLIVGNKGKGKTKHLLDKVNTEVQHVSGNIVYIDKSAKHMYELNNKVRLIDISAYDVTAPDEFMGFVKGIVSQESLVYRSYKGKELLNDRWGQEYVVFNDTECK